MDTTELGRALAHGVELVLGLTAIGVLLGLLVPGVAGTIGPHATLTGSASDALSLLANNARVLAVPFGFALIQLPAARVGRIVGDVVIVALTAYSVVWVGIALGRWRESLLPYVPHLPVEWAALSASVAAWLLARDGRPHREQLLALASGALLLCCAAAAVETWATPQRRMSVRTANAATEGRQAGRLMRPQMVPACVFASHGREVFSTIDLFSRRQSAGAHQPPTLKKGAAHEHSE
jgi:hypothetical protein